MNMLLKNGRILDPALKIDMRADVLIVGGVIEKIAPSLGGRPGIDVREMNGKLIVPGFIDMHVHFRDPGFEYKETIESGCRAAAEGGFTAVCCMPNTKPALDEAPVVTLVREKGRQALNGIVDVYPVAAVTQKREGKQLAPMIELAGAGAVAFSDDGAPVGDARVMRTALEYAAMVGRPLIQHAEEPSLSGGGVMHEGIVSTALGMPPIPALAEEIMIERDIRILAYVGGRYHVAHVSTAGSVDIIRRARAQGLAVSCEVTPHHFSLTDEAVRTFSTNAKMNPPLRAASDVEAMKEGLRDGTIDVIATDHAPHSSDEKDLEFVHAPFGIIGLETAIGLSVRELVRPGRLSLAALVEKFSVNPRRILDLPPVRIAEGERANLTLLDPDAEWTVDAGSFKSRSRNSPFHGWKLVGRSVGIINNGAAYFNNPPG
jgi:dihydroorotase